jgi:hypothetical protein
MLENTSQLVQELEKHGLANRGTDLGGLLQWAMLHIQSQDEALAELYADESAREREVEELREALCAVKALLETVGGFCRDKAFKFDTEQFGKDMVQHINIMGAYGDPDYLKGALSCRHVDLRKTTPKKKNAKA